MADAILAIRLRALGDVVLTTPALRALKRGHPDRALEVVTEARYAALLGAANGVDRVWTVERSLASSLALIRSLRRRRYALAVDFFGNPRSAWIARGCGARATAGYDLRGRRFAYSIRVARDAAPRDGRREYAAAAHVRLAAAVGGVGDGVEASVALEPAARAAAELILGGLGIAAGQRVVGLTVAGTWPTKAWPVSHAAVLARRLLAAGLAVIALVAPGEEAVAAAVTRLAPGTRVLPACGVGTLAAVVARLDLVAGLDSGPRHLAHAFGIPTFAWFGPTHPDNWTPPGAARGVWWTDLPCRGCNRTACSHWNCMPSLDPGRAAALVLDHLECHVRTTADLGPAARA